MRHGAYFDDDEDGWVFVRCGCGRWQQGPFPTGEDAADAYGDHRACAAIEEAQQNLRAADSSGGEP